jgi:hypothetical protein
MPFDFLLKDINSVLTCKSIGTDKGLAKIGDGVVNLTYSIAKSIFLTKINEHNKNIRTGLKVSKKILAEALKKAGMKKFAKSRADAHDLADTVEALVAYVWFCNIMTIEEIVDCLVVSLSGDLNNRSEEIQSATKAFTKLLLHIKKFLPES